MTAETGRRVLVCPRVPCHIRPLDIQRSTASLQLRYYPNIRGVLPIRDPALDLGPQTVTEEILLGFPLSPHENTRIVP
jgi:hypothetical protein